MHDVLACLFLLTLAGAVVAWIVVAIVRSPYTPVQCLLLFGDVLLTHFLWRVDVQNPVPLAANQGAVLVCNHRSSVDPFFIQLVAGRPVHWLVTKESFAVPVVGWFLRACEAIPVNRGGIDTAATKTAIRLASEGGWIGMFPEGRINTTDKLMLTVRPGAALIALRARVPVLPCYIEGSPFRDTLWSPFLMPARVRVRFGQPVDLSAYFESERETEVLRQATRQCVRAIAALASQPDFEPELAGRDWSRGQP